MKANEIISEIMNLDDRIGELRDQFEDLPEKDKSESLVTLFDKILGQVEADDVIPFSLVRSTDMICGLEENATSILIKGLAHLNENVRHVSGEALLSLIDSDIQLIESTVESVMKMGGTAAKEVPFLLTMSDDPNVSKHISKFLKHKDSDVVLAAVEALAEVGDPSCVQALKEISDDTRIVQLDAMDDGETEEWVLGKLAQEAIEMIMMDEEE